MMPDLSIGAWLAARKCTVEALSASLDELQDQQAAGVAPVSAWAGVVSACTPLVRELAQVRGVKPDQVEDVVQEVLLAVWQRLPIWIGEDRPTVLAAWLCKVMRNKAVNAFRHTVARQAEDLDAAMATGREPSDPHPGPELQLEQSEDWKLLQAALEELRQQPEGETNVRIVEAHYLERRSAAEIGSDLGLNAKAVRMRLCRTLRKLRAMPNLKKLKNLWLEARGGGSSRPAASVT